ncbi:hypothetical protein LCGC14_1243360 [marine sediment metagenome]|uniref:Uncharacterized protein n=1 Tax=marine sediment metagenome TaxID=412755 RepID=A0A0F9NMD7_9ZZZZ
MGQESKFVESIGATVDACIADIVDVLNKGGIGTVGSCCGHSRKTGVICLSDGRNLLLLSCKEVKKMSVRGLSHLIVLDKPIALGGNVASFLFDGEED